MVCNKTCIGQTYKKQQFHFWYLQTRTEHLPPLQSHHHLLKGWIHSLVQHSLHRTHLYAKITWKCNTSDQSSTVSDEVKYNTVSEMVSLLVDDDKTK